MKETINKRSIKSYNLAYIESLHQASIVRHKVLLHQTSVVAKKVATYGKIIAAIKSHQQDKA